MGMGFAEPDKHLILKSCRFEAYPNATLCGADAPYTLHPMEADEISNSAEDECEGEWGHAHAVGHAKWIGKANGKRKPSAPTKGSGKNSDQLGGKGLRHGSWGYNAPDYFPDKCHHCGDKGHKAVHCGKAT